jgi:F-type H+-transporting ATPase subunit epsilon
MAPLFSLEVHTPYRRFFSDSVEALVLTLTDGEVAVYAGHSAFTAPVSAGLLKIKDKDGNWKTAFTAEGILEVKEHKTVLVSDAAEWPGEIDYKRAKNAKERAEETLLSGGMKFETDKAAAALRRARMRMKVREEAGENRLN